MSTRRLLAVLASAALVLVGAVQGTASASSPPRYPVGNALDGYLAGLANPTSSPPGVNIWSCRPSAAHSYPVVLLPGTLYTVAESWQALGPMLADAGYCVYGLNYGQDATTTETGGRISSVGDIPAAAEQLAAFVTRVRRATGSKQVDIVGWSQGGMLPRWYINIDGGTRYVHGLVGLAPSNHGTTVDGLSALFDADTLLGLPPVLTLARCPACTQQLVGSSFIRRLDASGDTRPGVRYTVIETSHDEVVTPPTSAFLHGPDVTNILLQDQCPLDGTDHLGIPYDDVALQDVLNALGPDTGGFTPDCDASLPVIGTP